MTPFWVSAFLDFAPDHFEEGVRFWSTLTGYDVSPARGEDGEFATLVPPDGDDFLRVQRLTDGEDRIHLDLHVTDPRAAADRAVGLGAAEVADRGYVVMRSPGGLAFCFVADQAAVRPRPTRWPGGHASLLDQVCIDIPLSSYDAEVTFWSAVTGREVRDAPPEEEFQRLTRPPGQSLELLVQRLEEETGPVRAHFDWGTTDRAAETARHVGLGARVVGEYPHWTVLADPLGRKYCVTSRAPKP